jgi:hypothetical protein
MQLDTTALLQRLFWDLVLDALILSGPQKSILSQMVHNHLGSVSTLPYRLFTTQINHFKCKDTCRSPVEVDRCIDTSFE